jgi:hypothetical protein
LLLHVTAKRLAVLIAAAGGVLARASTFHVPYAQITN